MKKLIFILMITFIVSIIFVGCDKKSTNTEQVDVTQEEYIKLINPDSQNQYWLITEEKFNAPVDINEVINTLISDSRNGISKDTKLLNFEIIDETAYIDLSSEFLFTNEGTNPGETQFLSNIYTIVNSLCLNSSFGINSVVFLVDHQENPDMDQINTKVFKANLNLTLVY